RTALLVHAQFADRDGLVAERAFTYEEATLLLTDLSPKGFFSKISKLELVENAANLDSEGGFLIIAVESVGNRHDADAVEAQLGQDREHEVVVARQARKVVY